MKPRPTVLLTEIEASMVLSNWTRRDLAMFEILPTGRASVIANALVDAGYWHKERPSPSDEDDLAACIRVASRRRR